MSPIAIKPPESSPDQSVVSEALSKKQNAFIANILGSITTDQAIARIRDRKPEDLTRNFTNNIEAITQAYRNSFHPSVLVRWIYQLYGTLTKTDIVRQQFAEKQKKFQAYFDAQLFTQTDHASPVALPVDSGGVAVLKSPETLAGDSDNVQATVNASGDTDKKIGNTRYIFASILKLPSRSNSGIYHYQIAPAAAENGYAVPLDMADLLNPASLHLTDLQWREDALQLRIYAKNLYTIRDFKTMFAAYAALFFDTPQEAIEFFSSHYLDYLRAAPYSEDNVRKVRDAPDQRIYTQMRDVYLSTGIVPPISPEFQYKDSVPAYLQTPK